MKMQKRPKEFPVTPEIPEVNPAKEPPVPLIEPEQPVTIPVEKPEPEAPPSPEIAPEGK